jgi:endonuclease YncB( thermonuclease family)
MRKVSFLGLILVTATLGAKRPETIVGAATVIDGDTLEINETRIRLHAIDAPEGTQRCTRDARQWPCGEEAANKLRALVRARTIACTRTGTDTYGRAVATCNNGSVDLGAEMVSAGLALAYRQYGNDYVGQEDAARSARRGMWAGEFTAPWDYRHAANGDSEQRPTQSTRPAQQQSSPQSPPQPGARKANCLIKGNVNSKGERIYHLPGTSHYDQTVIDESRGERWFCSEEEARAAGWRAPRG